MTERELDTTYGEELVWSPDVPRFKPLNLAINWIVSAAAVGVAAAIVPHVTVHGVGEAFIAAAVIAILNAVLSPVIAALRLPFTLALSFVLVLVLDAVCCCSRRRSTPTRSRSTRSAGRCRPRS